MRCAVSVLAMVCASAAVTARSASLDNCAASSGATTMPLVELYTSEGCSSCPPADRWLSRRYDHDGANFLAFHVDYWDDIGWPDRFGSPVFSQRQRDRVGAAGERTVYTPQVMVGTTVRANWQDPLAWDTVLRQARVPARAALELRLQRSGGDWQAVVGAAPNGPIGGDAQVWLVRYVDGVSTNVPAGENRGAKLRHDRVVLAMSGPWPLAGATMSRHVKLPAVPQPWGLTAFVQNARGEILQSLNLHAVACDAEEPRKPGY